MRGEGMIESTCRICGALISKTDNMLYDGQCYDCMYNPYADQENKKQVESENGGAEEIE